MKLAVPTHAGNVDDHFGHCEYYTIFTIGENSKILNIETLKSPEGCGCKSNIAPILSSLGVTIMLAGNIGEGAINVLYLKGIKVIRGCSGDVNKVANDYLNNSLTDSGLTCHSHENCH
jgi:predicted Fe-Mo cluster-binding NifX family protein